jgi:hypothetical protein
MSDMTIPERADELDNALYGAMPADERLRLIRQALLAEHARAMKRWCGYVHDLSCAELAEEFKIIRKEAEGG